MNIYKGLQSQLTCYFEYTISPGVRGTAPSGIFSSGLFKEACHGLEPWGWRVVDWGCFWWHWECVGFPIVWLGYIVLASICFQIQLPVSYRYLKGLSPRSSKRDAVSRPRLGHQEWSFICM